MALTGLQIRDTGQEFKQQQGTGRSARGASKAQYHFTSDVPQSRKCDSANMEIPLYYEINCQVHRMELILVFEKVTKTVVVGAQCYTRAR